MVQFIIVSGKMAGTEQVARRFPFRIGRSAASDLRVDDAGVWDEHLEILFKPRNGYVLQSHENALVTINGEATREALLRNGDTIEIGALKLRFWLSDTGQKSLGLREWLTWAALAVILVAQFALIYCVIP